jgi:EAL domain-containing protein (putative c-di-GMP-specific phosphodiesterase class I)/DNA-binding NarL/FixJ family response regulator
MTVNKANFSRIKSILIIDDDDLFLTLIKTFCAKLIPQAHIVLFNPLTKGRPEEDFTWAQYDLLFLDYNLGKGENGLDWLSTYSSKEGFPPTIMMTGEGDEELAVEAMRCGAQYYMNKLKISIESLEHAISKAQVKPARQEPPAASNVQVKPARRQEPPVVSEASHTGIEVKNHVREHPEIADSKPSAQVASSRNIPTPPEAVQHKAPEKEKDEVVAQAPATTQTTQKDTSYVIDLSDAIKNNRIIPCFRPLLALSDSASQFEADLFQLRVNVLAVNDAIVPQEELAAVEFRSGNPGMLDLWVVRFALSQLLSLHKAQGARKRGLFIRMFEESLADNKLYDWMKSLLTKIKTLNIASTIIFEINPPAFLKHKTNAVNFINQMRDSWGTGFALYDVVNASVFETCQKQAGFEFLEVSMAQKNKELITSLAEGARQAGALTILENINSAEDLNMAIECGFDYGQGDFIQPPLDKLDLASEIIEI